MGGLNAQDVDSGVCRGRFAVAVHGSRFDVAYCSNRSLAQVDTAARRAVIVVHGQNRDADVYYELVRRSAETAGATKDAIIIAPQFLAERDLPRGSSSENVLFWSADDWKEGDESLSTRRHPRDATITSFGVLDAMLERLADRAKFPSLEEIVLTGHSAGGQFVNRFAAGSGFEPTGIRLIYVLANLSSYLYLTDERGMDATSQQFSPPDAKMQSRCSSFNRYKYGLRDLNPYMQSVGTKEIKARYASRHIVYLLGEDDTKKSDSLDTSCAATLQGKHRLERGSVFYAYLGHIFGPTVYDRHVKEIVPNVGHDAEAIYGSEVGRRVLFGDRSKKRAGGQH